MKNVEYYGVFVDKSTREKILKLVQNKIPEGWITYAYHITMLHRTHKNHNLEKYLVAFLGENVFFKIIGWGISDRAFAVITNCPSENKISHMTIAVAPGAKPVESNNITDWHYEQIGDIFRGYLSVQPHVKYKNYEK